MKKITIILAFLFVALIPVGVMAQDSTLPAPVTENTQPELPIGTETETTTDTSKVNSDTQNSFVNGALVGIVVGLIAGGIFTWFLKDKII